MKEIAFAVIGAGNMWQNVHSKHLERIGNCRCVAVQDPLETARAKAAEEYGARTYDTIEGLFAGEDRIDAVISCAPPVARLETLRAVAARKLPIFIEKPPSASIAEAREIAGIVRENSIPVSVGFMWRYAPAIVRMRELLKGQPVLSVESHYGCPALTQWTIPSWFKNKALSGGPIIDQAIHLIDLHRYLAGEIVETFSFGSNLVTPKDETCTVEDSSSTLFRFSSGATGTHTHSWVQDHWLSGITVRTASSILTLRIDSQYAGTGDQQKLPQNQLEGCVNKERIKEDYQRETAERSPHLREMEVFVAAVRSGDFSEVRSTYGDAAHSLAAAVAVNESMESGLPVKVQAL